MQFEIFLVSASYVAKRKFEALEKTLIAANSASTRVVRLEHEGDNLFSVLTEALQAGATSIVLRPVAIPFSQSLRKWVPNAAADWLARQPLGAVQLSIAEDLDEDAELINFIANRPIKTQAIEPKIDGLNGNGWDEPPQFEHHLLVCTGPRCHMRGSFGLLTPLKSAVAQAGLSAKTLIASTGCLYPCNSGPILIHYPKGDWYQLNSEHDVQTFVREVLIEGKTSQFKLPFSPHKPSVPQKSPQPAH